MATAVWSICSTSVTKKVRYTCEMFTDRRTSVYTAMMRQKSATRSQSRHAATA